MKRVNTFWKMVSNYKRMFKMRWLVWLIPWSTWLGRNRHRWSFCSLCKFVLMCRLQYGADPRLAESVESNTAMHLACQAGNLDFVKLLT